MLNWKSDLEINSSNYIPFLIIYQNSMLLLVNS